MISRKIITTFHAELISPNIERSFCLEAGGTISIMYSDVEGTKRQPTGFQRYCAECGLLLQEFDCGWTGEWIDDHNCSK